MNLYIDIGNTSTKLAVDEEEKVKLAEILYTNNLKNNYKEIVNIIETYNTQRVYISSVNPKASQILYKVLIKKLKKDRIVFISSTEKVDFKIDIEFPDELGTDIVCDIAGAHSLYEGPILIVDCGTATKVIYLSKDNVFSSCVIVPGISISFEMLFNRTALINRSEIEEPKDYLNCHNTKEVLSSSIIFGHIDMIKGAIKRYEKLIGEKATIILTGGNSMYFKKYIDFKYDDVPALSLIGLKEICKRK